MTKKLTNEELAEAVGGFHKLCDERDRQSRDNIPLTTLLADITALILKETHRRMSKVDQAFIDQVYPDHLNAD